MNVCLVSHNVIRGDGQGRVNYEIARGLLDHGHHVVVVSHRLDDALLGHVDWRKAHKGWMPGNLCECLAFATDSKRILQGLQGLDVVHANGFVSWAASDVNTAHFVHSAWLRSPHHIARSSHGAYGAYQGAYTKFNARWERKAFTQARVVVAVSEAVRQDLISHANVLPDKLRVIRNGVDPDEFRPMPISRKSLSLPDERYLALFVGGLRTSRKNLDCVLRALMLLPEVHLAVVGDLAGSPYPALVCRLGLEPRVHFLGYRRDIPQLMAASDVFVFPSHSEADPLVLREAMSSALPVITAVSVGGSDIVEDGINGFLLPDENDARALAGHIEWLRDHNKEAREMGRKARALAVEHSWCHMVHRYLTLYEGIAGEKGV